MFPNSLRFDSYLRINGGWQDHILFALLESDPVTTPGRDLPPPGRPGFSRLPPP